MKNRITKLVCPVFMSYTVHIEITDDMEATLNKYTDCDGIKSEDFDAMSVHVKGEYLSYMFFVRKKMTPGTIAHEAWHVVRHMLEYMGVDLDNETVAYYLGYMVDFIYSWARRKKK